MTDSDITIVRNWFIAGKFPARTQDFAPASHDLKSYWVGRRSLFLDDKSILWRNRSDTSSRAQLVVPRSLRDTIFNDSHHTTYGGHFGITHTHTPNYSSITSGLACRISSEIVSAHAINVWQENHQLIAIIPWDMCLSQANLREWRWIY